MQKDLSTAEVAIDPKGCWTGNHTSVLAAGSILASLQVYFQELVLCILSAHCKLGMCRTWRETTYKRDRNTGATLAQIELRSAISSNVESDLTREVLMS